MNREQLIAAMSGTPRLKMFHVEGWGTLHIRPLTVAQVDLQQQESRKDGKDALRFARAAARMLCDEHGVLLFDEASEADLQLLASQPWESLRKVLEAEIEDAGLGEDAAKNG